MKRDFKDSIEQMRWEHATESMKRSMRALRAARFVNYDESYWRNRLNTIANDYPTLRHEIDEFFASIA